MVSTVARRKRDVIADFWDALDDMGEYCDFYMGSYSTGMAEPEWTRFRHREYDGTTAFAEFLRTKRNFAINYDDFATSGTPPSKWALFVAWLRLYFLALRQRPPMRWRRLDASWRPVPTRRSPPPAFAWTLFSKEDTLRLERLAQSHDVSLQAWLLWALKETILPELVPGSGVVSWKVPLSMHGAFPSEGELGVSSFSLDVTFPPEAGPEQIHQAIRREMKLRRHWVVGVFTFKFAKWIPRWALRWFMRLAMWTRPWQGSFSASLAMDADSTSDLEEWFIGRGHVLRATPLGICCAEWRGRLSLSIQIHPAVSTDPQVARDWVATWRRFAEGEKEAAL
jgi:hypothetical protein